MSSKLDLIGIQATGYLLAGLGVAVLVFWHHPLFMASIASFMASMAYNTALGFLLAGGLLLLFSRGQWRLIGWLSPLLIGLGLITLIEGYTRLDLYSSRWFYTLLERPPSKLIIMASTTAICFMLEGVAFFLLSRTANTTGKIIFLPIMLCCALVFVLASMALLGHGLGLLPIYSWRAAVMAPHTALGHFLLSLQLFIVAYPRARVEFDRLAIYERMTIAFGIMVALVIGMGSISILQIKSASVAVDSAVRGQLASNNAILEISADMVRIKGLLQARRDQQPESQEHSFAETLAAASYKINTSLQSSADIDPLARANYRHIVASYGSWQDAAKEVFLALGPPFKSEPYDKAWAQLERHEQELNDIFNQLVAFGAGNIDEFKVMLGKSDLSAILFVSLAIPSFLIIGFLLNYWVTRSISLQLLQISRAMRAVANGDTQVAIPCLDNPQEIGDMARILAYFAGQIELRQQAEAYLGNIIEAAPSGFIIVNAQGIIETVNKETEHIFGYSRQDLVNQAMEILLPASERQEHPAHRQQYFAQPSQRSMGVGRELFGLHKSGRQIPVEIGLAPIKTAQGMKVLASVVDISERRKAESLLVEHQLALQKINRQLVASNKELATFTYIASHDLKSPLRGLEQISNWIDEDIKAQEYDNLLSHTEMMRKRIRRLEKLLDDLLNFYRAGHTKGELAVIDVKHMASEIFEIHNTIPGMTLECIGSLPVFSSLRTPFEQIVRNFISNALKHHDLAVGAITLECRDLDSDFYEFCISDDGPGVPAAFHQRIFGMFQTLRPRDEVEGSGIGLSLIKKIVETVNGTVRIESEGRGSRFFFTWPKIIARPFVDVASE